MSNAATLAEKFNSRITRKGNAWEVTGDLDLSGTAITQLPESLQVRHIISDREIPRASASLAFFELAFKPSSQPQAAPCPQQRSKRPSQNVSRW